jgi:hypothetical protein
MSIPPQQRPPSWQGPRPPQPPPPLPDFAPDKKNTIKWLLIAVAVLLVVGVTIGATLHFTRDNGGGGSTTSPSAAPIDVASANDTGPVAIITQEPTCDAYYVINNGLAGVEGNGWSAQRATLGPVADWTPDQHAQAQAVATAMKNAADQAVGLAKQTPHRAVRELYEQFIAYGRAYANSIWAFTPADNFFADAQVSMGNALVGICNAIKNQSVSRTIGLEGTASPTGASQLGNPADPQLFLDSSNTTCDAWIANSHKFDASTSVWQQMDTTVPGSGWTSEQRATQLSALPAIASFANDMESAGRRSGNPIFEDFAVLGSLYFRAYVAAGDTYTPADSWLTHVGSRINNSILGACQAPTG